MSHAFGKLFARSLCLKGNSGSQLDPSFLFKLGRHPRYRRPLQSKDSSVRQFAMSIVLKAQRSQTLDRRFGSSPAFHFLLVEALMTSPPSHNAPKLRRDIREERQTLARACAAVPIGEESDTPLLLISYYSTIIKLLVF